MKLIQVTLTFCCCGIEVDKKGIIRTAAPILRGWVGKPYSKLYLYYEGRGKLVKTEIVSDTFYPLLITNCKRCGLHKFRRNIVIGRGVQPADILFMGEAPGRSENAIGKAFIGRSGKLLDRIISDAAQLARLISFPTYFMTNTLLCRPTDSINGDNRKPTESEILACRPLVKNIINYIKPKEIVFVGKVSERYYKSEYPGAIRILHPAFLLRHGGESSSYYWVTVRQLSELFERIYNDEKETILTTKEERSKSRKRFKYS